jgi:hypothetical protein
MDEQLRSRLDAGIRDAVLKAAVEAGLLLADGERRGRVYRASPLVAAVMERVRNEETIKRIPDPFTPEAMVLPFSRSS